MAKLFGAQRLVLQVIQDSPKDAAGFVTDDQVAESTRIALKDVREWIETLEGEGYVEVARVETGLRASITAKGRLQLGLYEPVPPTNGNPVVSVSTEPPRPEPTPAVTSESVIRPEATNQATDDVDGHQVVLLIHGIRDQGEWQSMIRKKLSVEGRVEVIPIKYGYFDALRFWFPFWTRNKPIVRVYDQIRVALQQYRRSHPEAKLSIVAHSFGTYVVGEILKRGFDLQIHRLILCGSVLPQDFPWHQLQGRFDDDKVVNECGKADIWPVLAQSLSWGYGASGTHGFGAVLVKDRYHAGGHGQFFEPDFVEKYWVPFVQRGEYEGTDFETKMPRTPWLVSVLGILPLKWMTVWATWTFIVSVSFIFAYHGPMPTNYDGLLTSSQRQFISEQIKLEDEANRLLLISEALREIATSQGDAQDNADREVLAIARLARQRGDEAEKLAIEKKEQVRSTLPEDTYNLAQSELRSANIAFNAPNSMRVDETVTVYLKMAPTISIERLQQQIPDSGTKEGAEIQVSELVEAKLVGSDGLKVDPISGHEYPQVVSSNTVNEWIWDVKALGFGNQKLRLAVFSTVSNGHQKATRTIKSFESEILVSVGINQRVQRFLRGAGPYIVGLGGLFISIVWFFRWRTFNAGTSHTKTSQTILSRYKSNRINQSVSPTDAPPQRSMSEPSSPSDPTNPVELKPIRLFYSYSHKDERLRGKLEEHLALLRRQGLIAEWHDRMIGAGQEWKGVIDRNLEEASVILLLVSASFLASDYCYDVETRRAVERHDLGEAVVIPIIVRPCDWNAAPFSKLQVLPRDAKAVTKWANKDEAWADIARGIRRAVQELTETSR